MFNFFKKTKLQIYAPVSGRIIPLEDVPDPVFSQKMMGEGIAIIPSGGSIHAPIEGTIIQIAGTNHAIGILAKDGTEILIHVGLETVGLKGEGFAVYVHVGDEVSMGQLLIEVNWEYIEDKAKSIITPIVITNSHEENKQYILTEETVGKQGQTVILTVSTS
ncbi:PTS glucose transporter subunit IIA [Bacillus sp. Bva_UNVM-123]|uniref:PTS glucose transporter subunit IIA n=1 Tax=Bacillus sp. Bva_UNVM-123 TaxID=2829798 RepID=UPI00391F33BC